MDLLKLPYEHPIEIEWKIKKSDLQALKSSTTKYLYSPVNFSSKIFGIQYYLEISPYGFGAKTERSTCIGLRIKRGNYVKEIEGKYQICIESANFIVDKDASYIKDIGKGIILCKSNEFFDPKNNYFVNDEVTVKINGTLKFERPLISKFPHQISTKWTIKAAELEELRTAIKKNCLKKEINVFSTSSKIYDCYFEIFPNGPNELLRGEVFFAFNMKFHKDNKAEVDVTYSINSANFSEKICYDYDTKITRGKAWFSTADLFDPRKGYIVNEEMNLEIEGHLFVEKKDNEFVLLKNDENIEARTIENTHEKNFKIIVDFLASVSTVWNRMLQSGMKEAIERKMEITDFPFKVVDAAIKLIYGISPTFTLEDMLPLLVFSDKYDIQLIKELVEDHLISELSPSNVCQLIHFSTLFNASKLYGKSVEFFRQCSHDKTAVSDLDLIDKEMYYKIFSSTFPPASF